ncbi:12273_t:CDS:2 [Gigaspora rosea]|nr:12273_t:CDS:2 [Gigaspora rosea]
MNELNYEPSNELIYEPIEELLSDNTIKYKSSEDNYYELLDEILSDNTFSAESFLNESNYSQESFNEFERFDYSQEIFNESEQSNYFQEQNNNEDESEQEIYLITEQLRVKEIIHSLLPMEYPPTSEDGTTISIILKHGITLKHL